MIDLLLLEIFSWKGVLLLAFLFFIGLTSCGRFSPKMVLLLTFLFIIILSSINYCSHQSFNDKESKININPEKNKIKYFRLEGPADSLFLRALFLATGYQQTQSASLTMRIHYEGKTLTDHSNKQQPYFFSGGGIVITIDGETCCCLDLLRISSGSIMGGTPMEVKLAVENKIRGLLNDFRERVIKDLKPCLPQ